MHINGKLFATKNIHVNLVNYQRAAEHFKVICD